jgi:two-component system, cell cycle response regulator
LIAEVDVPASGKKQDGVARAKRYGRSLTVLNCQIDATGRGNQQLVGSVDDELALGFVSCATTCIRTSDWLVRAAEKEFMIVLPETDERGARCVARKLSEAFARRNRLRSKNRRSGAK